MIVHTGFQWNYTTFLNIIALIAFAALHRLYRHRDTSSTQHYPKDLVCGMQVEKVHARPPPAWTATSTGSAPITAKAA